LWRRENELKDRGGGGKCTCGLYFFVRNGKQTKECEEEGGRRRGKVREKRREKKR